MYNHPNELEGVAGVDWDTVDDMAGWVVTMEVTMEMKVEMEVMIHIQNHPTRLMGPAEMVHTTGVGAMAMAMVVACFEVRVNGNVATVGVAVGVTDHQTRMYHTAVSLVSKDSTILCVANTGCLVGFEPRIENM